MPRLLVLLALLLSATSAQALLHRYVASEHESRWEVSASPLYCALSHEIPIYGKATFQRRSGETLGFHVEPKRLPREAGMARLTALAPDWKHDALERDLGQVGYTLEQQVFRLQAEQSRRLLLELEQGMFPTFRYRDWADGRDEVAVSLSAVNIRASLDAFLDCMQAQMPFGFDKVKENRVYFNFDSSVLTSSAKRQLQDVARYILADEEVSGVSMCGHTDNVGRRRYNLLLGKRRAVAVKSYLEALGVTDERYAVKVKACGEKNPFASNRTAEGRALNRAVRLTLIK